MSQPVRVFCRLLAVLVALAVFTGCKKPKFTLGSEVRMSPTDTAGIGVGGTPVDQPLPVFPPPGAIVDEQGSGDWTEGMGPLADDPSASSVLAPQRWVGAEVYFAYDSAAIGPSEMPKIKALAGHLAKQPTYGVVIEGHCDERGSDEYNRALGQQRAIVVRDHLCAEGVAESRIETVSYGEERPAVPNATDENGHQKNRRAEFLIGPLNK